MDKRYLPFYGMVLFLVIGLGYAMYMILRYRSEMKNMKTYISGNKRNKGLLPEIESEYIRSLRRGKELQITSYVKDKVHDRYLCRNIPTFCGYLCLMDGILVDIYVLHTNNQPWEAARIYVSIYFMAGCLAWCVLKLADIILDRSSRESYMTDKISNYLKNQLHVAVPVSAPICEDETQQKPVTKGKNVSENQSDRKADGKREDMKDIDAYEAECKREALKQKVKINERCIEEMIDEFL